VIHQFKNVSGLQDTRPDFLSDQHIQGILLSVLFLPRQLKLQGSPGRKLQTAEINLCWQKLPG